MESPEEFEDFDGVDEVVDYQGPIADLAVLLNRDVKQKLRTEYLKHLREDWRWYDDHFSEDHGNGFVTFRRRDN